MSGEWPEEDLSLGSDGEEEPRTPLWSYASRFRAHFLGLYLLFVIPSLIVVAMVQVRNHDGILDIWFATIVPGAAAMALSGMLAYSTIEAWRGTLVLAESIRDDMRRKRRKQREQETAKVRAEGQAEGRAEAHGAWEGWNRRRIEAEARGEIFSEPPPSLNGEKPH